MTVLRNDRLVAIKVSPSDCRHFQIELELECWFFEERGKPEYPEKNLSERRREPTINSTHIFTHNPHIIQLEEINAAIAYL